MSEGGSSNVRKTVAIIAILWLVVMLVVIFIYYALNFTQYMDTVRDEQTALSSAPAPRNFMLMSSEFGEGESIPSKYTCDQPAQAGDTQISPPLSIDGVPTETKSLVLIMEDRDLPKNLVRDGIFLHWVLFNIPPQTSEIAAGASVGIAGTSGNGVAGYMGPCPPPQYEPREHTYHFDLYALDASLDLPEGARVEDVRASMEGRVIQQTTLTGTYQRREK